MRELREPNDTTTATPRVPGLTALVEAQDPGRVAVVDGAARWTYGELNAAAGRLARRLAEAGVGRGDVVALYAGRSARTLAAMLAVLRTGAAYLPVDPDYPDARVRFVLEDSGARTVLVPDELRERLPADTSASVLSLDDDLSAYSAVNVEVAVDPMDPGYLLYTSGSTGRPKGVAVPHRALLNFLAAMRDLLNSGQDDVWLALTSLSFDISGLELYLPLVTGGRTVIAEPAAARDGHRLAGLIRAEGVTHVQATPSGWRVLLAAGYAGPNVTALVGGEALTVPLARELRARTGRLFNVYGPTETTIWSTAWEVPEEPADVSIGRPIANTQLHVLDERGEPAETGELYIGGHGVALGYHRRPGLTAERFVPDPYGPPGARLYRTGDLVRAEPGGLRYLGRTDTQVKLRGHRIELGEVESALEDLPGVRQAVAAVHQDALVAYLVGDVPDDVRERLAERLPAPMVPALVVPMEALPLTPNGKVDRKALPEPAAPEAGAGAAPRTAAERAVAEVFAEVLGLAPRPDEMGPGEMGPGEPAAGGTRPGGPALTSPGAGGLGLGDDFFLLGGHSLLAARAAARITRRLGVEAPVAALFAHPTVEGFARALEELAAPSVPLRPRPAGSPAPMSPSQERVWFLYRLDPDDASYNVHLARRLRGPLDAGRLADALTRVAARHEPLRTRFPEVDGVPVAVVEPPGPVPVERLDLSALPEDEREAAALRLVTERVNTPLDLAAAPPVRATLIRLSAAEHVLCVVFHHVIGDGWSQNVLLSDLAACYAGRELPALAVGYGDVVHWRREREAAGAGEAALAYWRERLAGAPPLELPADRPRSPGLARRGAFHRARLPHATVSALEELGRRTGTTLFMVLLAAYQALLGRHAGQDDLTVGTAVAGRDRVELEPLVGFLADTLVLRADLSGDPAFTELLARTRESVLGALGHGDVPMERLGAGDGSPLFSTMMILHTQDDGAPVPVGEATAEVFHAAYAPARFDLTLDAWPAEGALDLVFGYEAALFDAATVEGLARRFTALLAGAVAEPEARLSRLTRVTGEERERLVHGPNDTATALPAVPGLLPLVEARDPGRVAVVDGAARWTYGELDATANRLARRLAEAGVGRGDVVALYAGRSARTLAAMLAVLKTGAAYLPVDPDYPDARVRFVLEDSGARAVLVPDELRERLPATPVAALSLDADLSAYSAAKPEVTVHPEDPAYLLYTSGSTGRPKGVVVPHRALLNLLVAMRDLLGSGEDDVWLALTSLSFDISGLELYLPLVTGGRTVIAGPEAALDGALLAGLVRAEGVTHVQATPSGWRVLLAGGFSAPEVTALAGGEALSEPLARELRARTARLFNVYGPTETTIWSTAWEVPRDPGHVLIGRPIGNTQVYVLDEHGEPAYTGELHLGGHGLALGYHRRPALTAERFVPGPFGAAGGRLYRTGDVVRLRTDGTLQYVGRTDTQVKLRGHRIELGEIESALESLPGVRQAVASVHQDTLIAYLVGDAPGDVRERLAERLPAPMVPSLVVPMEALPRTPNGKIDRGALPVPGTRPGEETPPRPREAGTAPPLSPAQERLWFLHSYLEGDTSGHLSQARRLRGPLDEDALAAAVAALPARHEALRTRYEADAEGRPRAVVQDAHTLPLARHDLSTRPGAAEGLTFKEAAAAELVAEVAGEPFDLGAAPPVRAALIRLAPDDHVLCLAAHPIAADDWTLPMLLADLAALYEGRDVPPPPVQAGDVTLWRARRERLAEPALEQWCARLAGAPVLDLPLDRPRPAVPSRIAASHEARLGGDLARELRRLGADAGGGLSTVLLAAYQVLLARQAGQTGFVIGLPVPGRERPELSRVAGHLTRHLVLRGDLSGDPGFGELLRRTQEAEREAGEHADLSPERLVTALGVERDPGREPLFQTTLTVREQAPPEAAFGEPFAPRPADLAYDVALEARPDGDGLVLAFHHDAAVLTADSVARLADGFLALLGAVARNPARRLTELAGSGEPAGAGGGEGAERVLDPWGVPVPPGAIGELWRGGVRTGERVRRHPDGRLERLPAPPTVGTAGTGPRPAYVAPRTDAEALVADVWGELLGVARVGVDDDFFRLGGHSLLAVRAAARLRATVEVDVPIRTFFTHRTLAGFAAATEEILLAELEDLSEEEALRLLDPTEAR
ncbi:Linear gramicidin synthase subunit B [Nonomuraea coxensis DSM 45129]|uniref:Linear gramicidin synthase subunit B n=1 Tax=Nonomuraea coxensis DSM 45129 TaxID=1122611 RepID=A0ABX8U5I0_9ACTN|nr:non-ribosomal peptide synthetase [Nonomuraea coxensis]QYC42893.1 Linear gramicidin synthase subunit B [Nonomuraea coxensis DSM 45129]